jgi:hypothetical protein
MRSRFVGWCAVSLTFAGTLVVTPQVPFYCLQDWSGH